MSYCKDGWTDDHEEAWILHYLIQLEHSRVYQLAVLKKIYEKRAWWERFINYCHTGE